MSKEHSKRSRLPALPLLVAWVSLGILAFGTSPAVAAMSRTTQTCTTRTTALTGWKVYTVCLTATDSYDGSRVTGFDAGVYCNVYLPTGAGWACSSYKKGSYWNGSLGAWEDWLNYAMVHVSAVTLRADMQDCVYLRVDTKPNGATSYRGFINGALPVGTTC